MDLKNSCFQIKALGQLIKKKMKFFSNKNFKKNSKKQATRSSTMSFVDCLKIYLWKNNECCGNKWCALEILLQEYLKRPSVSCYAFKIKLWDSQQMVRWWHSFPGFFEFSRNFTLRKFQKTPISWSANRVLSWE